jgi:hypothetical protein
MATETNSAKTDDPRKVHPFRGNVQPTRGNQKNSVNIVATSFESNVKTYSLTDYVFTPNMNDVSEMVAVEVETNASSYGAEPAQQILKRVTKIPYLKVHEFQTSYLFNWQRALGDLINSGAAAVSEIKSLVGSAGATLKKVASSDGPISDAVAKGEEYAKDIKRASGSSDPILGRPIDLVKEIFNGKFVAQYELPYFGDVYLKASSAGNWKTSDSGGAGVVKSILRTGINIDYPTTPTWEPGDPLDAPPIELEISLYNDSFENLLKNFKFLHSFTSGAFWIQDNYRQRNPNVYDVELPGYFQYYYCALDIEVKTLGMKRRLSGNSLEELRSHGLPKMNENTFFPDAYKLEIKFTPIVPNNFNMYVNYLINGSQDDVEIGGERQNLVHKLGDKIKAGVDRVRNS